MLLYFPAPDQNSGSVILRLSSAGLDRARKTQNFKQISIAAHPAPRAQRSGARPFALAVVPNLAVIATLRECE